MRHRVELKHKSSVNGIRVNSDSPNFLVAVSSDHNEGRLGFVPGQDESGLSKPLGNSRMNVAPRPGLFSALMVPP